MRLYAGVIRFFVLVLAIHIAVFAVVATLARRSRGFVATPNTLRLAGSAIQVRSLDPIATGDTSSSGIASQVYEGLVAYDQATLAVVPCLAESWDISPDGKLYTFRIRRGVCFHDDPCFPNGKGRELTAHDVKYNLTRVCDPLAMGTAFWLVDGRVVGAHEYSEARQRLLDENERFWEIDDSAAEVAEVEGLRVLDDYTFRIELTKPFAPFVKVLAMTYFDIAAPEAIERYGPRQNPPGADTFFQHPVGTGPFTLEKWEPDVEIVLRANPEYWGRDEAGRPLPNIDAVHLFSRRDPHTAFMEFEEAHSDIAGVPDQDWDRVMREDKTLKEPYASRYELQTSPTLTTFYYGFNMRRGVFATNERLRQALNYAIDRESIIKQIYRGVGSPAYGPIPPGLPGHDPHNKRYEYNPQRAKQLLAEAGYPNGEGLDEVVLYVSGAGDTPDRTSVAVMEQLRLVGVNIHLKQQPWPLHLESIDSNEAEFFRLGWIADYPDAENFLALFLSRNHTPGPNATLYSNPEFDRLYDQAMLEPDEAKRTGIYRRAAEIVIDECPWLFTTTGETISLRQPWIKDYPTNPLAVGYFKNLIIDRSGVAAP